MSWSSLDLPYRPCLAGFAKYLSRLPGFCWLDSSQQIDTDDASGWSVLAAKPRQVLSFDPGQANALAWLSQLQALASPPHIHLHEFCFSGVMGFLSYDFGRLLMGVSSRHASQSGLPLAWFGRYELAVVVDHRREQSHLIYRRDSDQVTATVITQWQQWYQQASEISLKRFVLAQPLSANIRRDTYEAAIAGVHHHLRLGDSYQVNFTQRFSARSQGDALTAYLALRQANPASYGAFLRLPRADILSLSPEVLVQAKQQQIVTRPIKGTIARSLDPQCDQRRQVVLRSCPKNQGENVMIVDLLRNDLSKVCQPNSVKVTDFLALQSLASVHHLVSTVSGVLCSDNDYAQLLAALFPGGSITGAPKRRTMQLIDELEAFPRGIYCGSIGHMASGEYACFNIAIRTLLCTEGWLHCYAGGGIVLDSTADEEYQESLDKVAKLRRCLERFVQPAVADKQLCGFIEHYPWASA